MKAIHACPMFLLGLFLTSVYAQNSCLECLKAAQEEQKACLASAISEEDKKSCQDRQGEQMKVCEGGECRLEREKAEASRESPSQGK
jgi:hypothetical protein